MKSINRTRLRGWQKARRNDLALPEVLHVLWEWRRLVFTVVLVLMIVGLVFGLLREREYTAEAIVIVEPKQETPVEDTEPFLRDVQGAVASSENFIAEVRQQARWRGEPDEFARRLDVQSSAGSSESPMLQVRFEGEDAEGAVRAANAYATLFVKRVELFNDRRLAGGSLAAEARVAREASAPESRPSPGPLAYAAGAIAIGVLIGGGLALLLESRTHSWRDARDAELTLRAPVLGVIPEYSSVEEA